MQKLVRDNLNTVFSQWWFSLLPGESQKERLLFLESMAEPKTPGHEMFVQYLMDSECLDHPQGLAVGTSRRKWTQKDVVRYQTYYAELFRKFKRENIGELCGWLNNENQQFILNDLSRVGDLNGKSILDLGSGPATFLELLQKKGVRPKQYVGVEINKDMIALAKKRMPEATVIEGDCFQPTMGGFSRLEKKYFDVVVVSGMFGLRPKDWNEKEFNGLVLDLIQYYLQFAKEALAMVFIPQFMAEEDPYKLIAFHTFNRMAFVASLSQLGCRMATLDGFENDFFRIHSQTPLFLYL